MHTSIKCTKYIGNIQIRGQIWLVKISLKYRHLPKLFKNLFVFLTNVHCTVEHKDIHVFVHHNPKNIATSFAF